MQKLQKHLETISLPVYQSQQYLQKGELNVLFVNPETTGANLYKMLLPYVVLKGTGVVHTAITGVERYNPTKRFRSDSRKPVNSLQVLWSDTIVIPFTNQDITEFMEMARTVNPNTKIVIHVDFDFIDLPQQHPLKDAFSQDKIDNVVKNILFADKVVVSNPALARHLLNRLPEMGHEIDRDKLGVQLLCVDPELMLDGVNLPKNKNNELFTLCVLAGDNHLADMKAAIPLLLEAKKKNRNTLKIVFFGVNKNKEPFPKMVKGLEYVPEGAVPIWKYYERLAEINPNAVFIPSDESEFSQRSNGYKRWLDASMLEIPVISPKTLPLEPLVKQNENGWLYSSEVEFHAIINNLIKHPEMCVSAGKAAKMMVDENFSYTNDKLQRLINLIG